MNKNEFSGFEKYIKPKEQSIVYKKWILTLSIYNPKYSSLNEAESQTSLNIKETLDKVISAFNERTDGQRLTVLKIEENKNFIVLGLKALESSNPSKLVGSFVSKRLYNTMGWHVLIKSGKNRLFHIEKEEYEG